MDLLIHETGSGGDLSLKGNDLAIAEGLFNMPYLGWFGGNPNGSTTGNELPNEQRFDWWGNSLLFPNDKEVQLNSLLENALNINALDSEGRNIIEESAKEDLKFLTNFADIEVDVFIATVDKIEIQLKVNEPSNLENKEYKYIWDATRKELITEITI